MKLRIIAVIVGLLLFVFLALYRLDSYVMKPGHAYSVGDFISVQSGDEDDEGTFSLMTQPQRQALEHRHKQAR